MRNIFSEKSYKKCGIETSPKTFSKKSNLSIFWDETNEVNQPLTQTNHSLNQSNQQINQINQRAIFTESEIDHPQVILRPSSGSGCYNQYKRQVKTPTTNNTPRFLLVFLTRFYHCTRTLGSFWLTTILIPSFTT